MYISWVSFLVSILNAVLANHSENMEADLLASRLLNAVM